MLPGPLFRREFRAATRRRGTFGFRVFFALTLSAVAFLIGLIVFEGESPWGSAPDPASLTQFACAVFFATFCLELFFLVFLIPAYAGGSIAEEREANTLPLLLLTRLRPSEIVLTKLVARWLPATSLLLTGLPLLAGSAWAAGMLPVTGLALAALLSSSAFMAALALLASACREQAGPARVLGTFWIWGWLVGPPIGRIVPASSGTFWGDLMVELKALCGLIAPSSPVSLATDPGWFFRPWADSLTERVALMIGLQALFGLLALAVAATRLKAREPNPNWTDPTRGYRPPCGDDPIYWREYELPYRRGGSPLVVLRLRYVLILLKAIGLTLVSLLATLLALAVPIGLLVAAIRFGAAAFWEVWLNGDGPNAPFTARSNFNLVLRAATALLWLFPVLGLPAIVAGRLTSEKDKRTWEPLLTTPLDGDEILWSKARATVHSFWQAAWPVFPLWGLGLACDALLPLGAALAALDLVLASWAALSLGLYLGVRPGTTSAASTKSALSMLVFLAVHTPLVGAALLSPREAGDFGTWSARLRWGVVAACLTIPALTGALAWLLTRQTRRNFDQWVGRPCRATQSDPGEPPEARG